MTATAVAVRTVAATIDAPAIPATWVDLANLAVAAAALGVTVLIFRIGRRLSFSQKRARVVELTAKAWKVMGPIRNEGMNSKVIIMNSVRYFGGYDGSNDYTWRGPAFIGHEIIEIRHGGIQVITGWGGESSPKAGKLDPSAVLEVGHIPWEWIDDIEPGGDEYDGSAIFFVEFRGAGRSPFNYRTYVSRTPIQVGPSERDYYPQQDEYGTRRPRPIHDRLIFLRLWWSDARMNRRSRSLRP